MSRRDKKYRIGYLTDRNGNRKSDSLYIFWTEGGKSKRCSTGTDESAEAEEFLAHFILEREAPPLRKRDQMTIEQAFDDYLREHGPNLANIKRPQMSKKKVLEYFGADTIDKITPSSMRGYIDWRKGNGLKNNSVRRELIDLRAALNHQVLEGRLETAPRFRMPEKDPPKDRWLTPEEAHRLYFATESAWLKLFMDIALRTGQRKGAIIELQWNQVKFEEQLIYFNPSGRKQTTKRRAIVPISPQLHSILLAAHQREGRKTDFVIESPWGGIRGGGMLHGFRNACNTIGLGREVTPHTLRHTVASWLAQEGIDHWMIQRLLGHSEASMTERYMHHNPTYLREAVNVLDRLCASFARNEGETTAKIGVKRK